MPRKACKTGTSGIHKTGQKSTSIINQRVLIYRILRISKKTPSLKDASHAPGMSGWRSLNQVNSEGRIWTCDLRGMNPTSLPDCSTSRYCAQSGNCAAAFYGSCQPNPRRWARTTSYMASAMVHYAGHPICYAGNPPPGCNTRRGIPLGEGMRNPCGAVRTNHMMVSSPWSVCGRNFVKAVT